MIFPTLKLTVTSLLLVLGLGSSLSTLASPTAPKPDNIYHQGLPKNADVFPRMGKTVGSATERNNCRQAPWGKVVATFPGSVFVEIDQRTVDRQGVSWFRVGDRQCWLHDSRINLL